jgi:hypothetical protein
MPNIPDVEIDLTPVDVRLVIEAGWPAVLELEFADPAMIAGWTNWGLQTRPQRGATHGELDWTPDATDQGTGIIRMSITKDQANTVRDGSWWEFAATNASGDEQPLMRGPVVVKPNIKR